MMKKYLIRICKRNPSYLVTMQSRETRIYALQSNHVMSRCHRFGSHFALIFLFKVKKTYQNLSLMIKDLLTLMKSTMGYIKIDEVFLFSL